MSTSSGWLNDAELPPLADPRSGLRNTICQNTDDRTLVEKDGSLGRGWQAAGIMFAEHSVSKSRNDTVAEVSQGKGNDPEHDSQDAPAPFESHQDSTHRAGADVDISIPDKHECIESVSDFRGNFRCGGNTLQGSESKTVFRITGQKPVDRVVAESAYAIEEDNGRTFRSGVFRHRFSRRECQRLDHT